MKNLFTIFLLTILIYSSALTQQKEEIPDGWTPTSEMALNISQIAFSNWSQGGQNSLTWAFLSSNGLGYRAGTWIKRTNLKLSYGRTKISGEESRVNDNEFFLETVVSKDIGWVVDPYFSNNVRTPIAPGYDYAVTPSVQIVGFFDPGYVTQSIGFTYGGIPGLQIRAGFAVQEIFTNRFRSFTDDPETPEIEAFKVETGIETVTEANYNLGEQFAYKSNLRLFGRFEEIDVWDVRWDNLFTAKINDFLNVNFNVLLLYDIKQTRRTQLKEALQLGIYYKLI
jgi:hypothetical protein